MTAQPADGTGSPVSVRLVADTSHISPGQESIVAIHVQIARGWRIFWTNPGDSGTPTDIRLAGPSQFDVSALRWPAPERFDNADGSVQYGYQGDFVVPATVTAPDRFEAQHAQFDVTVDWMACRDECTEGSTSAVVELPRATAQSPSSPANSELIEGANARLPNSMARDDLSTHEWRASGSQRILVINLIGAQSVEYYPSREEEMQLVGAAAIPTDDGQVLQITYRGDEDAPDQRGVVSIENDRETRYLSLDVSWSSN